MFEKFVVSKYRVEPYMPGRKLSTTTFIAKHKSAEEYGQDVADIYNHVAELGGMVVSRTVEHLPVTFPEEEKSYIISNALMVTSPDEHSIIIASIPE